MITKTVASKSGNQHVRIDKEPNECPFCHHTITPEKKEGYLTPEFLELHYRCTNNECQKYFIAYYSKSTTQSGPVGEPQYVFVSCTVGTFNERLFDERIYATSPMFSKIYNQALRAENLGMDQIAGMGFRKAIEFLIKDYLSKKRPEKENEIKEKLLGPCINDFVENENIKEISRRAVWLGNDETHYTRKWEDKDISDLKKLIDITLHWLEMELRTEEYIREMP